MPIVQESVCPCCSSKLPLVELYWRSFWSRQLFLVTEAVGLICPSCGVRLVVGRRKVVLLTFACTAIGFAAFHFAVELFGGDPKRGSPLQDWGFLLTLILICCFGFLCAPRLAIVRPKVEGDNVTFPFEESL